MFDFLDATALIVLWFSVAVLMVTCFILGSLDIFDEVSGPLILSGVGLLLLFVFILTPTLIQAGMMGLVSATLISLVALGFLAGLAMIAFNIWVEKRN